MNDITTQSFTVLHHSIQNHYIASIHRAGCRDIKHEAFRHGSNVEHVAGTLSDALDCVIDEMTIEQGYTADDCQIHACCTR